MDTFLLEYHLTANNKDHESVHFLESLKIFINEIWQGGEIVYQWRSKNEDNFTALITSPDFMSFLVRKTYENLVTVDINAPKNLNVSENDITRLDELIDKLPIIWHKPTPKYKRLPKLKRGYSLSCYDCVAINRVMQYDFDEVVFDKVSKYQHVRIMHSKQYGNCLFLDGDLNLAESDMTYTLAITGNERENYSDKEVLILGGGDGGILNYLKDKGARKIIMIDIDEMVIQASQIHLRGICGSVLDQLVGQNYEIIVDDCVKYLKQYAKERRKFDFVINDLTAIPVSTDPVEEQWDFLRLILQLSMDVMKEDGKYFTQGNAFLQTEALEKYNQQLQNLTCKVNYQTEVVCVPSYLEQWVFYTITKTENEDKN